MTGDRCVAVGAQQRHPATCAREVAPRCCAPTDGLSRYDAVLPKNVIETCKKDLVKHMQLNDSTLPSANGVPIWFVHLSHFVKMRFCIKHEYGYSLITTIRRYQFELYHYREL